MEENSSMMQDKNDRLCGGVAVEWLHTYHFLSISIIVLLKSRADRNVTSIVQA